MSSLAQLAKPRYDFVSAGGAVRLIALFISLLATSAWAAAGQRDTLVSKPYDDARHALLARGFQPVTLKHERADLFCYEAFCSRYPEVLNCAGTGLNPCEFVFVQAATKKYLIVDTHGEERLTVTGIHWAHDYELRDIDARK